MTFFKFNYTKLLIFIGLIGIIIFFLYLESCYTSDDCPIIQYNFSYYGLYLLMPISFLLPYIHDLIIYFHNIGVINNIELINIVSLIIWIFFNSFYLYLISCIIDFIIKNLKNRL